MKFEELTNEEFDKYCNDIKCSSFYQSSEWAKLKETTGWIHYFLGVKQNNKIVGITLVLGRKLFLNKYLYYAPRGILIDYSNKEVLSYFINEIKKFLIKRNGIVFKIDPLIEYRKHDNLGNNIGESNDKVIMNLCNLGFVHHGFTKGYNKNEIQLRWSYALVINNSLDELISNMNHRCKRCIKKYKEYPLELEYVNDKNKLNDFKKIMESTATRQKHYDRSLEYYNNLNNLLKDKSVFVIIYLNKKEYLNKCKNDKLYNLIKTENKEKIPITAGVFIFDKNKLNYVYGGTYKEYMPFMAQYMMQIEMIKLAKSKNLPIYDFGGISGDFNPKSSNYGVYDFKRGFGGYVIEYIGEFDLILSKFWYHTYNISYKVYHTIKKIMCSIKSILK